MYHHLNVTVEEQQHITCDQLMQWCVISMTAGGQV